MSLSSCTEHPGRESRLLEHWGLAGASCASPGARQLEVAAVLHGAAGTLAKDCLGVQQLPRQLMLHETITLWPLSFSLTMGLILTGNSSTYFVFWKQVLQTCECLCPSCCCPATSELCSSCCRAAAAWLQAAGAPLCAQQCWKSRLCLPGQPAELLMGAGRSSAEQLRSSQPEFPFLTSRSCPAGLLSS